MSGDPRVPQLVDEILSSEHTPEEVCADCPALLPEVRARAVDLAVVCEPSREIPGPWFFHPHY
jgi:serine/threonine-protein kinase